MIILKHNWKNSGKVYQSISVDNLIIHGHRSVENTYNRFKLIDLYNAIKPTHSILDIGCNLGALCIECERIGCKKIVGIDKKDIIHDANTIIEHLNIKNVMYYGFDISKGDLNCLFNDVKGTFDHVFALAVMMYIPIEKFWKVIRTYVGDNLWFETNHNPNDKKYRSIFKKYIKNYYILNKIEFLEYDANGKHLRFIYHLVRK